MALEFSVLWHVDVFRRSFRELTVHACMAESCIFCALKDLFTQLQFSQEAAPAPDALRSALARAFCDRRRFQLGLMDDAAECFETILLRIHFHLAAGETEDTCSAKQCIPHRKFAMTLVEQSVCGSCGATSEPLPFTQMVHYVSASALTSTSRRIASEGSVESRSFGRLLRLTAGVGELRDCPGGCGAGVSPRRALTSTPDVVSVGIIWDSERPPPEAISAVLSAVGTTLRPKDLFHAVVDARWASTASHNLVGLVAYYGRHYSTFFFHSRLRAWIYVDDASVREVGPRWEQVVDKCRRGRFQPLLLLYADPAASPIRSCDGMTGGNPTSPPLHRRSMTPGPERNYGNLNGCVGEQGMDPRRVMTPGPDPHAQKAQQSVAARAPPSPLQTNGEMRVKWDLVNDGGWRDLGYPMDPVVPDHLNNPGRRDSGNWSGDRNSASSSSSTSVENPYSFIPGGMQRLPGLSMGNSGIPKSPTSLRPGELSSSSSGPCDQGYDSYSLSSTDSLPLQQNLRHNLQLAQIPEGTHPTGATNPQLSTAAPDDCERLCLEADRLLEGSRRAEEGVGPQGCGEGLETALALCRSAASKARAAMDAPYNNPHMLTVARMKHSACIMRARSLHRRLAAVSTPSTAVISKAAIVGAEEGINRNWADSNAQASNVAEGAYHVRSNGGTRRPRSRGAGSGDGEDTSVRMYATLPRRKAVVSPTRSATVETQRLRSGSREKRARSEERKGPPGIPVVVDVPGDTGLENTRSKKQHRIRRKLLGGPTRRRNGSMPDLHGGWANGGTGCGMGGGMDSAVSLINVSDVASRSSGYLSEGHLEYNGNQGTDSERSRPTRRSFHGSMGRVPPPPPPRTTSRLCTKPLTTFQDVGVPLNPCMNGTDLKRNSPQTINPDLPPHQIPIQSAQQMHPASHQMMPPSSHQMISNNQTAVYDEVDGPCRSRNIRSVSVLDSRQTDSKKPSSAIQCSEEDEELPPYPSPPDSPPSVEVEEFPLPPPPIDLATSLNDDEIKSSGGNSFLDQIKRKREQILGTRMERSNEVSNKSLVQSPATHSYTSTPHNQLSHSSQGVGRFSSFSSGCQPISNIPVLNNNYDFKKEVPPSQSVQSNPVQSDYSSNIANGPNPVPSNTTWMKPNTAATGSQQMRSVRDLASCFESMRVSQPEKIPGGLVQEDLGDCDEPDGVPSARATPIEVQNAWVSARTLEPMVASSNSPVVNKPHAPSILHTRDDAMIKTDSNGFVDGTGQSAESDAQKRPPRTKKSVTFCDRVVLVATAEDEDSDCYVPNPILERVLRSALDLQMRQNSSTPTNGLVSHPPPPMESSVVGSSWPSQSANQSVPINHTQNAPIPHNTDHDHPEYMTATPPSPGMMARNRTMCSPVFRDVSGLPQQGQWRGNVTPMQERELYSRAPWPVQNEPTWNGQRHYGPQKESERQSPVQNEPTWNGQRHYGPQKEAERHSLPPYRSPPMPSTGSAPGPPRHISSPLPGVDESVNRTNVTGASGSPCHLCRKKIVSPPAIYCPDCDFYMSRFRPRT
ncbi:protein cordon-bleu [Hetaerina americana]|uniref:protein cordon-bleu n=1 Tax=Hetaerina americana TaxID=62018 RepID=UPI003A7F31F8